MTVPSGAAAAPSLSVRAGATHQRHVNLYDEAHANRTTCLAAPPVAVIVDVLGRPKRLAFDLIAARRGGSEAVKQLSPEQLAARSQNEEDKHYTIFIPPRMRDADGNRHRRPAWVLSIADCIVTFSGVGIQILPSATLTAVFIMYVFASNILYVVAMGRPNPVLHTVTLIILMVNLFIAFFEGVVFLLMVRLAIVALQGLYLLRVRSLSNFTWFAP